MITVISPIGVYPPKTGASIRIHNIFRYVAKYRDVFIFSQGLRRDEIKKYILFSKLITMDSKFKEYKFADPLSISLAYIFVDILKAPKIWYDKILEFRNPKILKNYISKSEILQVEHPWQFKYIYNKKPENTPIVLDEHNVEYDLYKQLVKGPLSKKIIKCIWNMENFAVNNADVVFAVSKEDKNRINELYEVPKSKIYVIPNGTQIPNIKNLEEEKINLKKKYGFYNKKIVLFVGSKYLPNIEAVKKIIEISKKINNKDILFVIVGGCSEPFKDLKCKNVIFKGFVDDVSDYFKMADIAINPILSGSGTNIKMLEYMAYRLPIITTKIGARGLELTNKKDVIISNIDEFPYWIETLANDEDLRNKLGNNARKTVESKYDWKIIGEKINKIYNKLI